MGEPGPNHSVEALIVCVSESHGNTLRVAESMAVVLRVDVIEPEAVDRDLPSRYDLVGFGSGIYFMSVHHRLLDLVGRLPPGDGRCAFTFSTSGTVLIPWLGTSGARDRLREQGYRVLGDFNCRGLDTAGPLRLIGGINRVGRMRRIWHELSSSRGNSDRRQRRWVVRESSRATPHPTGARRYETTTPRPTVPRVDSPGVTGVGVARRAGIGTYSSTNVTSRLTWYDETCPSTTCTCCSFTQADVTLRSVSVAVPRLC